MTVMTPSDENECRQMLYTASTLDSPAAVRYPRGAGPGVPIEAEMHALPVGKGEIRREASAPQPPGRDPRVRPACSHPALAAAEALDATVANMRFVKPLDVGPACCARAHDHDVLVTVEENVMAGGAGSAVAEALAAAGVTVPMLQLGLPDHFIDHGDPAFLLAHVGLDAHGHRRVDARALRARVAGQRVKPAA